MHSLPRAPHHALRRERAISATASAAIVVGGLAALAWGLGVNLPAFPERSALTATVLLPEARKTPEKRPQETTSSAHRGAPAPESRKTRAAPVLLPAPRIVLPSPVTIVAARHPGDGDRPAQGSGTSGSGSGSGGRGNGSGGGGGGEGAGVNEGVTTLPRQIAGRLHYADLPADLRKARSGADLTLRYRIGIDGRVSGCTVISSSGRPDLDAGTCQRITERFRFRPARDAQGQPVPFVMTETHGWDDGKEGP